MDAWKNDHPDFPKKIPRLAKTAVPGYRKNSFAPSNYRKWAPCVFTPPSQKQWLFIYLSKNSAKRTKVKLVTVFEISHVIAECERVFSVPGLQRTSFSVARATGFLEDGKNEKILLATKIYVNVGPKWGVIAAGTIVQLDGVLIFHFSVPGYHPRSPVARVQKKRLMWTGA